MCTSPLRIWNNSKQGNVNVARFTRFVPCGECEECLNDERNAWFVRIHRMIDDTVNNGGIVLFPTFTYNNESLPYIMDEYGNKLPCFNRNHKITFIDSFRHYLLRKYHVDNILYLWVNEYGVDSSRTMRPHNHVLFFIPHLKEFETRSGMIDFLLDMHHYCKSHWQYGWCIFPLKGESTFSYHTKGVLSQYGELVEYVYNESKKDYNLYDLSIMCVSSEASARYVSKYCCKQMKLYDLPLVKAFLNPCEDDLKHHKAYCLAHGLTPCNSVYELKKYNRNKWRVVAPRHWQSHKFGTTIVDKIKVLPTDKQIEVINKGIEFKNFKTGQSFYYKLPRYFLYLLTHNTHYNKLISVNDVGLQLASHRFDNGLRSFVEFAKSYFTLELISYYNKENTERFYSEVSKVNLIDLYLYGTFWCDMRIHKEYVQLLNDSLEYSDIRSVTKMLYVDDKNTLSGFPSGTQSFLSDLNENDYLHVSNLNMFNKHDYAFLWNFYFEYKNKVNYKKSEHNKQVFEKSQRLKLRLNYNI